MDENTPIYNSRILRSYLEYIGSHHPRIDLAAILAQADMSRSEVLDPGHWFSQRQVDRFQHLIVEQTGDDQIALKSGRQVLAARRLGGLKEYVLGLGNLGSAYSLLAKIYPLMSRGATVKTRKLGTNRVEILCTPKPGVVEKPFQCQNRRGSFEALSTLFACRWFDIEHPDCYHRGDGLCRYIISWRPPPMAVYKRLGNIGLLAGVLSLGGFLLPIPPGVVLSAAAGCLMLALVLWLRAERLDKRDLASKIEVQGNAARTLISELDNRYNHFLLIQEVAQSAAGFEDAAALQQKVADLLAKRLDYAAGFFLLATPDHPQLRHTAGFGHDRRQTEHLTRVGFEVGPAEPQGLFDRILGGQAPEIIEDIKSTTVPLAERELLEKLNIRGLIGVPLVYEHRSMGVLVVHAPEPMASVTRSELNLLMGVAAQTAVGINSAAAFKRLKASEEKHRLLADNATDIIFTLDPDSLRFTYLSPSVNRILGYKADDSRQLGLRRVLTPAALATVQEAIRVNLERTAPAPGPRRLELEVYRQDRTVAEIEVTTNFIRDGAAKVTGILGIARDIGHRRELAGRLKQSLHTTRTILESLPVGIMIVGAEDKSIRMVNQAFLRLCGLDSSAEIIGKICHQRVCPSEIDCCPVLDLGNSMIAEERVLLSTDGQSVPILKTVVPIVLEEEKVLLEAMVEISDLKRVERQLQQAKESAEAASRAKSEFLANMSHELRTPLNHIIGFTQMVVDKNAGELNALQEEYLGDVLHSSQHLLELISDILDLSKVEAGKVKLNLTRLDPKALLAHSLGMIRERANQGGIRLHSDIDGLPVFITADPRRLKQILYNLLSNAVKFTPRGGKISLTAQINAAVAGSEGESGRAEVQISVTDSGIGIRPQDQEQIFKPFEQVDSSASRRFQGTGLGLSITRRLVALHGGRIWAQSAGEGQGSRFSFTLPL